MRKTHKNSIFVNYIFNLIKNLLKIAFPIITLTYSARILGAEGVGKVNFVRSIITYFTCIAMLGVNYYGIREGARLRDKSEKLSIFTREIFIINLTSTIVSYFILILIWYLIPKFREYDDIFFVCALSILLSCLGMEWLYTAIEEFKYIAIRTAVFQIIALIIMFIFVRQPGDILSYAIVMLVATTGSLICNFFHSFKIINWKVDAPIIPSKHLKPIMVLFAMEISIELYTVLDSVMLGFYTNDTEVGLYSTATKVIRIVATIIATLGTVMIPRLSYHIEHNEMKDVKRIIYNSFSFAFFLSVPIVIGLILISKDIMHIVGGNDFIIAYDTLSILSISLIFSPISMAINQQTFIPMRLEWLIVKSTIAGGIVDFLLNIILLPVLGRNGAAISTVAAEIVVMLISLRNARINIGIERVFKKYYQYYLCSIPIIIICILGNTFISSLGFRLIFDIVCSCISYFGLMLIEKNDLMLMVAKRITNRLAILKD